MIGDIIIIGIPVLILFALFVSLLIFSIKIQNIDTDNEDKNDKL